jgi:hypothetical protein
VQIPSAGDTRRGRGTILVIDSSGPPARLHAAICHLAGYDVLMRRPDELGSRLPQGWRPGIVLVDVAEAAGPRPRIPGVPPTVPTILISGSRRDADRFADLQYDAVLIRPVRPSQLRDKVGEMMAMAQAPQPRPSAALDGPTALVNDQEDYADVRAMSERLRQQSRDLREYARRLRARAWKVGDHAADRRVARTRPPAGTDAQ